MSRRFIAEGLFGIQPHPESSFTSLLERLDIVPAWTEPPSGSVSAPEATTVLALGYQDGVVVAGDRQATEGYAVAHRRIQKVFPADDYSAVAISGTAGLAIELVRLFQTELEHYEKLEGVHLSLEGKANYLARLVRQQLPLAFQGLVVVPLFAGYDDEAEEGRLFTFDVVGGRYEERDYGATGSGGREAKAFLRERYEPDLGETEALELALRALVAAAEEDTATAGPDLRRGIFPNVVTVTSAGFVEIPEDEVAVAAQVALDAVR